MVEAARYLLADERKGSHVIRCTRIDWCELRTCHDEYLPMFKYVCASSHTIKIAEDKGNG